MDDKNVEYKGKRFTLSALAALMLGKDSSAAFFSLLELMVFRPPLPGLMRFTRKSTRESRNKRK